MEQARFRTDLAVLICGIILLLVMESYQRSYTKTSDSVWSLRTAEGPGGYLDENENRRRNMQQTGVHDVQIPLEVRQQYAKEKGLEIPQW